MRAFAMAENQTAEAEPAQLDSDVWTTGPDGELVPNYDATFPIINEGEVVSGKVVRVDKDEVLVDIGYKSEGVIPVAELSIRRSIDPSDEVNVGDEVDALVLTKEDAEGRLILSKKRARFEMAWKRIERAAESGEPVEGTVIEVVKGGLILDLGVRGFLPASLVDIRRVQDLDEFMAKQLRCKVIELNRSRNNVVLSRRAVLEEERKEMRQAILDRLSPGDVVTGTISNIVDFGAFVDLDGIDGLIHISELSWSHVNHPSELLEIGQEVEVKVLDIDRERQRISLGLKQTQSDPWQEVVDAYDEGDVVDGKVTKVVTFGAFVEIRPGVEGLVHISELAQHHVENPREVVAQGAAVRAKIIEMDAERRRLSLSLKRVEDGEPVRGEAAALGLSEEVFADSESAPEAPELDAEAQAPEGETAGGAETEQPAAEAEELRESEVATEEDHHSIEADAVSPEEAGPGDSEGELPASPDEEDQQS
jgi:small subunit ribosomal protein S1